MTRSPSSILVLPALFAAARCSLAAARDAVAGNPNCTKSSLSGPPWELLDPLLVRAGHDGKGDIEFTILHIPTSQNSSCVAKDVYLDEQPVEPPEVWYNCTNSNASISLTKNNTELKVRENWTCESSPKLKFASLGVLKEDTINACSVVGSSQPSPGGFICPIPNLEIPGNLSSPVVIAPVEPQLPRPTVAAQRKASCAGQSSTPSWQVENLSVQHHYSATRESAKAYYDVSLTVTNLLNHEGVKCAARVDELPSVKNNGTAPWVKCQAPKTDGIAKTEVMLDTAYGVLGVRQTWSCTDAGNTSRSTLYDGTGYRSVAFNCGSPLNSSITDESGGVIGRTSDYNCSLPKTEFTGYSRPPAMPHTLYKQSCTINSFDVSTLALEGYEIATPVNASAAASGPKVGTFTLKNPGSGDTYRLFRIPVQDDGVWHTCEAGEKPLPWQLVSCQYQLDRKSNYVGFQVQWYCDDRDPSHAILFNATAGGKVPAEECTTPSEKETMYHGETECRLKNLPQPGGVDLPVSDLTWKSTSNAMDRGPILPWA
ncbi:hypothetical protein GQ53DRAFT_869196 [Thozetella sp. PMI_491]|nr:hypothetical protein GQ53DRAFT_869196 [Thozetella sp. PMI_491]